MSSKYNCIQFLSAISTVTFRFLSAIITFTFCFLSAISTVTFCFLSAISTFTHTYFLLIYLDSMYYVLVRCWTFSSMCCVTTKWNMYCKSLAASKRTETFFEPKLYGNCRSSLVLLCIYLFSIHKEKKNWPSVTGLKERHTVCSKRFIIWNGCREWGYPCTSDVTKFIHCIWCWQSFKWTLSIFMVNM